MKKKIISFLWRNTEKASEKKSLRLETDFRLCETIEMLIIFSHNWSS